MMPQNDNDYKRLLSEMIKKQILILGSEITLSKVKNVTGLIVDEQGEVTSIEGNPQAILQQLINEFVDLSGMIVKKTMESILVMYPGMIGMAAQGALGTPAAVISSLAPASSIEVTQTLKPQQSVAVQVASVQEQIVPMEPTNKSEQIPQPPSQTSVPLEPPTFLSSNMSDLDKALEALANSPMGVVPQISTQVPVGA